ncbi:MAG: hypothetical protein M1315_02175 [Candidatus Thermoplasmatota archaeon]|jgi:hypothetical protein|nr:hypothetical protein [Candidatus Thermoplasmatota archaeon]
MKNLYLIIGAILIAISLYLFLIHSIIGGIILLILGIVFIYGDVRGIVAGGKISSITYNGLIENGLKKIEGGSTTIKKEQFLDLMEKLKPVLKDLQFVPVVGFDSIYLQYNNEQGANRALSQVSQAGFKADIVQDKSTWSVRITF